MKCQVSMEEHVKAFVWLDDHLEAKIFMFDLEDVIAMVEQVVCCGA